MQHLEVSGAVRPLKWSLGVKWLKFVLRTYTVLSVGATGYHKLIIRIGLHGCYCIVFYKGSMSTEHAQVEYCSFV